jgi:hypothetical protein
MIDMKISYFVSDLLRHLINNRIEHTVVVLLLLEFGLHPFQLVETVVLSVTKGVVALLECLHPLFLETTRGDCILSTVPPDVVQGILHIIVVETQGFDEFDGNAMG